jgi:hypothetical protein
MDEPLRRFVRDRALGRCEYCGSPEQYFLAPFQVDHIIAEKHHGPTQDDNLAWSCYACNRYKGPNIAGWSSEKQAIVRLFHPRQDSWHDHFRWDGARLIGITEVGKATIDVLRINDPAALAFRSLLLQLGVALR